MARFNNTGIGLASSITDAPRPPIEIVAAAVGKAGYSLTGDDGDVATTELDVTLAIGQPLTLVNNGGNGYTDGVFTNKSKGNGATNFSNTTNQQTGQISTSVNGLTITYTVEDGQVVECVVGDNAGSGLVSGDSFTINGSAGDAPNPPAIIMIP